MSHKTLEEQMKIAEESTCPVCGRSCLNKYNFDLHMNSKHKGVKV